MSENEKSKHYPFDTEKDELILSLQLQLEALFNLLEEKFIITKEEVMNEIDIITSVPPNKSKGN